MKKWSIVLAALVCPASAQLQVFASSEKQHSVAVNPTGIEISTRSSTHLDGLKHVLVDPYYEMTQHPVNVQIFADPENWFKADLIELEMHDAMSACDKGELNLLPLHRILPSSGQMVDHFVSRALQPCAVGQAVWATLVAYDSRLYTHDEAPILIQDFFNIDAYPGKRAVRRTPRAFAEWVLHTAGISDEDIYQALDTEWARNKIEQTLHQMVPHILWVDSDEQAIDLLQKGIVSFAMVESPALVRDLATNGNVSSPEPEFGVIWDRAVGYMSMWAIPKQAEAESALAFLRFAIDPANNLYSATSFGYAPARKFQTVLIEEKYRRVLPIGKAQTRNLIWGNSKWWREHGEDLESWFSDYSHQQRYLKQNEVLDENLTES